jgi:hypothetical protein
MKEENNHDVETSSRTSKYMHKASRTVPSKDCPQFIERFTAAIQGHAIDNFQMKSTAHKALNSAAGRRNLVL